MKADIRARLESAAPLIGAYLLLATLYAWQAWRRETPTIFSDELETTQISRAIAETGHAARRGEPYGFTSLVPWLTAPFWWLHPVATAYESIKTVQAFVMAAAIFPAFLLARRLLSPGWAYFAAVAAIAGPALSYAPILVEEPWAYPAATLALWLTVRAVDAPGRWPIALALGSCVLAVLVRSQLVALFGALAFGLLALWWRTPAMRRWRASWSRWDWAGAVVLGIGAVIAVVAFLGHRSNEWSVATTLWKGRMLEYGSWAGGAFAIGIGVLPAIALLAMLAVPRAERDRPGVRAFVVVAAGAVVELRLVRGGQGRVPLDDVLQPHRRAEPRVPRAARVRGDRVSPRAGDVRPSGPCSSPGRQSSAWSSGCRSSAAWTTSRTTRRTASRSSRSRTGSGHGPSDGSRPRSRC